MSHHRSKPKAKSKAKPKSTRWRRWLLRGLLFGLALTSGFLVPYFWAIDRQVREEFGRLEWQVPTRVFARPLRLTPGRAMSAAMLERELAAARYHADGQGRRTGSFARAGDRFVIAIRAFPDLHGLTPERRVSVQLSGGRIASIADLTNGQALAAVALDPARIATLYGQQQEERRLIRLADAPPLLVTGLQAVEDRQFKTHRGVNPWAIARAAWKNLLNGEIVQGGSTLTQQLVRNLYLDRGQRWGRKLNEMAYALAIEARFDKQRILEAYLNQVYLGQDGGQAVHGVSAGAVFWFSRDLDDLQPAEIALLIGLIQGPSYYDPRRYPQRAKTRRNIVLDAMAETGLLNPAQLQAAKTVPLGISAASGLVRDRYPAFLDLVRRQLVAQYPESALRGAGLTVLTTLSPSAQAWAEEAARATLAQLDGSGVPLETGLVVTDVDNGDVVAVVGSRHAGQPGFNRALEAKRPIGSLIKPFVYLLALAQPGRWSLATAIDDAPIAVPLPQGGFWRPDNSDGRSHGRVALIDALAHSYNQATVRLGLDIGVERLSRLLEALAGSAPPAHPSLLLGAVDLSPLDVAQLYQFIASGGRLEPVRSVRGVLDAQGKPIARYDSARPPAQAGDALATRLVTLAMQEAVNAGTARQLSAEGLGWLHPAGKTGTSNDSRDSWFAGFTGDWLAVVWVGNDDNQPTGLYGATGAMRVWSALFRKLPTGPLQVGDQDMEWQWADRQEFASTDPDCPGARRYAFVKGFAPERYRGCGWERLREMFDRNKDRNTEP